MRPDLQEFVGETAARHGEATTAWKRAAAPEDRTAADAAAVGADSLLTLIEGVRSGQVREADLDPLVVEAFHLQYPNVKASLPEFLREHHSPDEMRGVVSGIKGKLFEIEHVDSLSHSLPPGLTARLASSSTQPGYDIVVSGPGHPTEYIQDKFTGSLSPVHHAAERWPDIPIAMPDDLADRVHDPALAGHILHSGVSSTTLNGQMGDAVSAATADAGIHIPWVGAAFAILDEAVQVARGRKSLADGWHRCKSRVTRSGLVSLVAEGAAAATGVALLALTAVPLRLAWTRHDIAAGWMRRLEARRRRILGYSGAREPGP